MDDGDLPPSALDMIESELATLNHTTNQIKSELEAIKIAVWILIIIGGIFAYHYIKL